MLPISPPVLSNAALKISHALRTHGFSFVAANAFHSLLPQVALAQWADFAASWHDLGMDAYMADGGRYRRRRFAAFAVSATQLLRKPPQPHYQSRDYNPLNGGVERWFAAITEATAQHPLLNAILRKCYELFNELTPVALRPAAWHVECHQFRIEAAADMAGQPTPEGLHRDGVDWVLVMLVARSNIVEGVTTIHDTHQHLLGSFTLAQPGDAAFVDDARVYHGVTPVKSVDVSLPAYRDVLVVTFRHA